LVGMGGGVGQFTIILFYSGLFQLTGAFHLSFFFNGKGDRANRLQ
jgi:hypothetical protein